MTLGLYPDESRNAMDALQRMGPGTPDQAGFLSGIPTGIATGVAEGEVKLGEAAAGAASFELRELQRAAMTPGPAAEFAQQTGLDKLDPDEVDARIRSNSQALLKSVAPDPMTTGYAGQVLHGIASVGTRVVGTGVAGAAVSEGYSTSEAMQAQGVDKNTAHVLGVANALMTGAGLKLPIVSGVGNTIAQRVASGAAVNAIMGAADRATMHTVLSDKYPAMAAQYRVMDGQAMAVDAILGGVFGAHGYLRNRALPSTIDAAHAANDSLHIENDLTPGVATSPAERDLHVQNLTAQTEALLNGTEPPELRMPDTVPNPAQDAIRAANAQGVADAQAEVLAEHGQAPAQPSEPFQGERRQDMIDALRLGELSAKRNGPGLTAAETTEWAGLLDQRRLTTRVGGRTIRGVGSYEAYQEMLRRGDGGAVVGFADSDMLHATNEQYGYPIGDELIRTTGETLAHYFGEGNVFRRESGGGGSDEFITHAPDQTTHDRNMEAAQRYLANHTLRAYDAAGNLIGEKRGAQFSHGRGIDETSAAAAARADKQARAAAGIRADRGAMAAELVKRGQGGSGEAAGTQTQAITKLAEALTRLKESNGKDTDAHEAARAVLAHAADAGWDADAIGAAAVARAGPGAQGAYEAARLRESSVAATAGLDPETRESVEHALSIIERQPNLSIEHPDSGLAVGAHDALNQALDELKGAKQEGELAKIAAACFGRGA